MFCLCCSPAPSGFKAEGLAPPVMDIANALRRRAAYERRKGFSAAAARHPEPTDMVIRNVRAVTMDPHLGEMPRIDIHIRDGEIVHLGGLQHAEVSEIDGSGLTALPGAIAAHRHLWTETVGSRAAAAAADPTDLYRLLRLTLLQQLAAGVTCLHNCIIDIGAEHAETALLAQIDSGLRGRFSYPLADDGGSHRALRELQATWFSAPQEHLIDLGLAGPAEARPDVAELAWLPATGNHAAGEGTAEARHDAGALEMEPWIGSLSPGKRADLILVRDYQRGYEPAPIPADRVEMVCIDGRVRKRNGVLLEPNEGLIRREGAEALARIIGGRAAPPSPATGARH